MSSCHINEAEVFYLLRVNNETNTRKMCKICSKLTIKTSKRRSSEISHISGVSIYNLEQVNAGWDYMILHVIPSYNLFRDTRKVLSLKDFSNRNPKVYYKLRDWFLKWLVAESSFHALRVLASYVLLCLKRSLHSLLFFSSHDFI